MDTSPLMTELYVAAFFITLGIMFTPWITLGFFAVVSAISAWGLFR